MAKEVKKEQAAKGAKQPKGEGKAKKGGETNHELRIVEVEFIEHRKT